MSRRLSEALRETAARLRDGARYEWGHVGRCNCGHLVQTLAGRTSGEIYRAFQPGLGEWSEHARDYCDTTGETVESLFALLERAGLPRDGVAHLEYLSDPRVLEALPASRLPLRRNAREDVVGYMEAFAAILEGEADAAGCGAGGPPGFGGPSADPGLGNRNPLA